MKNQPISIQFTTTKTSLKAMGLMAKIGELSPLSATFEDKTVRAYTLGGCESGVEIVSDEVDVSFTCEINNQQLLKIIEAMASDNA